MLNRFISIEGIDGCGKSTLIRSLKERYPEAVFVKEPGTTITGKELRRILLNSKPSIERYTEFLLYVASFVETTNKIVKPALAEGKTVFADRWLYSAKAYQEFPYGNTAKESLVDSLCAMCDVSIPDFNIILTLPFDVAWERVIKRNSGDDPEDKGYMRKVHLYYQTECPGFYVDANQKPHDVLKEAVAFIESFFNG